MKTINLFLLLFLLVGLLHHVGFAQAPASRFTYSAKLTFQTYGLPFRNIGKSFENVGAALSVDYALNQTRNLQQTFTIGYQSHTQHEAGYYVNTQFGYRPHVFRNLEPTIAIGIGRLVSVANSKNLFYEQENNHWQKSKNQSQGHWQAPISLSFGYQTHLPNGTVVTPFVGYDATPIIKYNNTLVVLPYSQVNVGTRFTFQQSTQNKSSSHENK